MFIKNVNRDKKILFYYDRQKLFNEVSLISNFMAKNLSTKEGQSLTDDYAMSDDEKSLFDVCVRAAIPDIYESMSKITHGIADAFEEEVSEAGYTESGGVITMNVPTAGQRASAQYDSEGSTITKALPAGTYVELLMQDNEAYNDNMLNLVDSTILNSLKQGILKEFYSVIVQPDLYKISAEKFVAELFKLKQRLFQLKKKVSSSNLS